MVRVRALRVAAVALAGVLLLGTTGCVGSFCWCDDPDLAPPRAATRSASGGRAEPSAPPGAPSPGAPRFLLENRHA